MTWLRVPEVEGTNYERVFAPAPQVYAAWRQLGAAVKQGMDEHRFELVTVAAAEALGSRYCTLAHRKVLRERFAGEEGDAGDRAAVGFARRIATDPGRTTGSDVEELRAAGLSEEDILHVVLTVAIRRFFTAVLHATGTQPDPGLEEEPWPARPSSA